MTSGIESSDIQQVNIEEEMKRSYLDYAMSVIVSRALPDVRDGLKPVHRRILYGMKEAGNDYNRPYRKSARVVGDVMGKYHPHGDSAIYDSMVRMAQPFSLRLTLIDGQGNFGSMDGDPPAAMRYTEARLSKASHEILEDLDKDTVDFQLNYDDSDKEPVVLPARLPNILINGGSGIAVGMATNIPTHNLGELIDACSMLIDDPETPFEELINAVKGPDFPTGGTIVGKRGIISAYETGRGSIIIRGKHHIEERKNNRESIVITEIPYQVNKSKFIERIAEVVRSKMIEGISDVRDESDRDGVRVVVELKKDAVSEVIVNQLYKMTQLQTSFGINMLALNKGRPEQMNLRQILNAFLEFREEVIVRRERFDLRKAREKAHLLLGLAVAVSNIDHVISLIKSSPSKAEAKLRLLKETFEPKDIASFIDIVEGSSSNDNHNSETPYILSELQVDAILELRLHRLTALERDKISDELKQLALKIERILDLLSKRQNILDLMKKELIQIRNDFATDRKTSIEEGDGDVDLEDLIQKEDMVVTVSMEGYIKRVPLSTYRAQRRGGRGRSSMGMKDEDAVRDVFVANTHTKLLFFSSKGIVYSMKVYRLPLGSPTSKGRAMINLLPLDSDERITTVLMMPFDEVKESKEELDVEIIKSDEAKETFMMFATSKGNIRRNKLSDFDRIQSNGKIAMKLDDGEQLISVALCNDDQDVFLVTYNGKCIRFSVDAIRIFAGRNSNGVRGIKLSNEDHVITMNILSGYDLSMEERNSYLKKISSMRSEDSNEELENEESVSEELTGDDSYEISADRFEQLRKDEQFILAATVNGFGKRTSSYEYRRTGRGGSGFDAIVVNDRNGGVVNAIPISEDDQILLVSDQGQMIRCPVDQVRIAGRRTQGVTLMRLKSGEHVVGVSPINGDDDCDEEIENIEINEEDISIEDNKDNIDS